MSVALHVAMSFPTFLAVVHRWFPYVRFAMRKTDYCDHCHLYQSSICPALYADAWEFREKLLNIYPGYFDHFDGKRAVKRVLEQQDTPKYCNLLTVCIEQYTERFRAEIMESQRLAGVFALEMAEKDIRRTLRWHLKVIRSYAWHKRSLPTD